MPAQLFINDGGKVCEVSYIYRVGAGFRITTTDGQLWDVDRDGEAFKVG